MKNIGIVGYIDNIKAIQEVIKSDFNNLTGFPVEINETSQLEMTVKYLKAHINDFDGIIFTGKIIHDIMNHQMHSNNPWVFLENDDSQLQRIFLKAQLENVHQINEISIDSYTNNAVKTIYTDFGLNSSQYKAIVSDLNIFGETFLEDLFKFHYQNCETNNDMIAITGVSTVYNRLKEANVPALLLTPNVTSIKSKLHDLIEKIEIDSMIISQIIVMSIEIDMNEEYDLSNENEYSLMLQKTKVTEEVYKFAQKIQAAVVENGTKNYLLFTTKQILEFETNKLRELPFLNTIKNKTKSTISVGIGFGSTAREAKSNAILGKNRSIKMGGNQCFVVFDHSRIERMTPATDSQSSGNLPSELPLKEISEKSGVSVNNIYKLQCISELYKKNTFTSFELSSEFGNSLRSMNRIIERLELAGYIEVVGRKIVGKAGRPSRILKLLF